MEIILEEMKKEDIDIMLRPETTGKQSQFGTMEELIRLSKELDNVMPCIDFSHLYARSLGKVNSYEDFKRILLDMKEELGMEALENLHSHISGIEYGNTGERKYLTLEDSEFDYKGLLKALKDVGAKGIVICESPIIEYDAEKLKKYYEDI